MKKQIKRSITLKGVYVDSSRIAIGFKPMYEHSFLRSFWCLFWCQNFLERGAISLNWRRRWLRSNGLFRDFADFSRLFSIAKISKWNYSWVCTTADSLNLLIPYRVILHEDHFLVLIGVKRVVIAGIGAVGWTLPWTGWYHTRAVMGQMDNRRLTKSKFLSYWTASSHFNCCLTYSMVSRSLSFSIIKWAFFCQRATQNPYFSSRCWPMSVENSSWLQKWTINDNVEIQNFRQYLAKNTQVVVWIDTLIVCTIITMVVGF